MEHPVMPHKILECQATAYFLALNRRNNSTWSVKNAVDGWGPSTTSSHTVSEHTYTNTTLYNKSSRFISHRLCCQASLSERAYYIPLARFTLTQSVYDVVTDGASPPLASSPTVWLSSFTLLELNCSSSPPPPAPFVVASDLYRSMTE